MVGQLVVEHTGILVVEVHKAETKKGDEGHEEGQDGKPKQFSAEVLHNPETM